MLLVVGYRKYRTLVYSVNGIHGISEPRVISMDHGRSTVIEIIIYGINSCMMGMLKMNKVLLYNTFYLIQTQAII